MNCPFCGAENPDGATFCNLCLKALEKPVRESLEVTPEIPADLNGAAQGTGPDTALSAPDDNETTPSYPYIDFSRPSVGRGRLDETLLDTSVPNYPLIAKSGRWTGERGVRWVVIISGLILILVMTGISLSLVFLGESSKTLFKSKVTSLIFEYPETWRRIKPDTFQIDSTIQGATYMDVTTEVMLVNITRDKASKKNQVTQSMEVLRISNATNEQIDLLASSEAKNNVINSFGLKSTGLPYSGKIDTKKREVNGVDAKEISMLLESPDGKFNVYSLSMKESNTNYVFSFAGKASRNNIDVWNKIVSSIRFFSQPDI